MIENLGEYNGYYIFFSGDNLFDNNFAVHNGGCLSITYGSRITVVNGTTTFNRCHANGLGGAIYQLSWSVSYFGEKSRTIFTNCQAKVGGAVYITDNSVFMMNYTLGKSNPSRNLFDSNVATLDMAKRSGMALYVETSEIYLRDVTIQNHGVKNTIELERANIVNIRNAFLRNNYAPDDGAGVMMC